MDYFNKSLTEHEKTKGKFATSAKMDVANREELCVAYTPGVAEPCRAIFAYPKDSFKYTSRGNIVAVISNGTAVLGLGNIGAEAAMPVMEGKALLFHKFAGIDAIPLCINAHSVDEIVKIVTALAPSFGGINLEDIASPDCFEVEKILEETLEIPVFHDDQHGTAIVVAAALINALRVVDKNISEIKIVLSGPGAAGVAIINMLRFLGVENILACDEGGILCPSRELIPHKAELARITNPTDIQGDLKDALRGADVFIGVSAPGILSGEIVATMNGRAIVFSMANPVPEISYDEAKEAGAMVVGTGRSDRPNQINNLLAFPGIFRGALDAGATHITPKMKAAAVYAIADIAKDNLSCDYVIPDVFDENVVRAVAGAVAKAAVEEGVVR